MRRLPFLLPVIAAAALSAPAAADISVTRSDEVWRVTADGENLQQIMVQLSEEAGFDLSRPERLASGPGFDGEVQGSLREVVERLLRGRDYALVGAEDDPDSGAVTRIVVLSDRVGDIAVTGGRPTSAPAERLPAPAPATSEESQRVTALLQRQIQPLLEAENAGGQSAAAAAAPSAPASNPSDLGDDELDAETQAALAEATRRAQADVQALANALRRHEESLRNGQAGPDQ